jgi:hypothetical protein
MQGATIILDDARRSPQTEASEPSKGPLRTFNLPMPIAVICPGCRAQFRVSDKFAGKEGPCPKCKTIIKVPIVEEITIHAPEEPTTAVKGTATTPEALLRPTTRKRFELSPVLLTAVVGSVIVVLVVAWLAGDFFAGNFAVAGIGLLALSIPLAVGAYEILRNEELEPFRGAELWIRASLCGLVYAALWGAFAYVPDAFFANNWNWLFIPIPFLLIGWGTAYFTFDLGADNSFFHYAFYLLATLLLRALVGLPALWNLAPPPISPG